MSKNNFSDSSREAAHLLSHGHYKKAIEIYKHLLKQESRSAWQEALKLAYLKWAQALAEKKMYQEAVTVWESCPLLRHESHSIEPYLLWLVWAGHPTKAIQTFLTLQLEPSSTQQFSAIIGILLLTEKGLLEYFPPDSTFRHHYDLISQAIFTYCQGEDPEPMLRQISFRSPYRDLRQILKAFTHLTPMDRLLEKIPADSPYQPLIQLIQWDIPKLLNEFDQLTKFEQILLTCLKGLNHSQVIFLNMLTKQNNVNLLFKNIATHQSLLNREASQQFCLALLPSHPHLIHLYEKFFEPLSKFDKKRIQALHDERQGQMKAAEKKWETCVEILKASPAEPDHALKIALILRHIVMLAELRGTGQDDEIIDKLKESLQFDPKDKQTHLHIIELLKNKGDKRASSLWIDLAVKQFPREGDILEMALQTAWVKKAYKKAITLAKKLLQLEPFHPQAKQILFSCHLAYTRKLIKTGKYELAHQELDQADRLAQVRHGVIPILRGLLAWQERDPQDPVQYWFQQSYQLDGGTLIHLFHLNIEAQLLGMNLSFLPLEESYLPSAQEILRWVHLINTYYNERVPWLAKQVELFKTPVQRAMTQTFSKTEMISICQCFRQIKHYELLYQYAQHALQSWPATPILVFYHILGKTQDEVFNLHELDIELLQKAVEHAQQQSDQRTVMMIMRFLEKIIQDSSKEFFEIFLLEEELDDIETPKKTSPKQGKRKS